MPYQRICEEYPVVRPNHHAKKFFRRYSIGLTITGGLFAAYFMPDDNKLRNEWYTRPDFKPKAAMVKDESMIYDKQVMTAMKSTNYNENAADERKKGSLYRFFRPLNADYNTVDNNYIGRNGQPNFNPEGGKFPTLTTDYTDHEA